MCFFGGLLIGGHGFRIEVLYFKDVDGDTTTVPAACPLWVLLLLETNL